MAVASCVTAPLADQGAAERREPLAGRADRLVQDLVARAGQPGLHQARRASP